MRAERDDGIERERISIDLKERRDVYTSSKYLKQEKAQVVNENIETKLRPDQAVSYSLSRKLCKRRGIKGIKRMKIFKAIKNTLGINTNLDECEEVSTRRKTTEASRKVQDHLQGKMGQYGNHESSLQNTQLEYRCTVSSSRLSEVAKSDEIRELHVCAQSSKKMKDCLLDNSEREEQSDDSSQSQASLKYLLKRKKKKISPTKLKYKKVKDSIKNSRKKIIDVFSHESRKHSNQSNGKESINTQDEISILLGSPYNLDNITPDHVQMKESERGEIILVSSRVRDLMIVFNTSLSYIFSGIECCMEAAYDIGSQLCTSSFAKFLRSKLINAVSYAIFSVGQQVHFGVEETLRLIRDLNQKNDTSYGMVDVKSNETPSKSVSDIWVNFWIKCFLRECNY